MVRILGAANSCPGETLSALLRREPVFLFPHLEKRGFRWLGGFTPDGSTLRTHRPGAGMSDDDLAELVGDALRSVIDPELGHNIVDLGLVYAVTVVDGAARIVMTATTPGCPAVGFLKDGAANSASRVPGVRSVDVVVTFTRRGRRR